MRTCGEYGVYALEPPLTTYRKEYVGKGPNSIRVSFKDNRAIAHMTGVLSKVESFYLNDKR
ncbi:Na-translocating system protein MpsC family protein, partial [Staphylococcus aureus]|uniref:Na-translocating system protein MpsC family protein n=1 Tax=Staphylococcus aureus TaxID=1280 RepID=UPI001E533204